MKVLGSPIGVAACALLLAAAVHPAAEGLGLGETRAAVIAFAALLLALAIVLRGFTDRASAILAAGVVLALGAAGYDALQGHGGRLILQPGEGAQAFEEEGTNGMPLGLRPIGAAVHLDTLIGQDASLTIERVGAASHERLTPGAAVRAGDYRLGWGDVEARARLHLSLSKGDETASVEVAPGEPGSVADLDVELERYFPDFALDERNNPYTKSDEPRNPGALLRVSREGGSWRVFVLQSMPGVHQVPELGWTFALQGVSPEPRLRVLVHHQPAALLAAAGIAIAAVGLGMRWRS
jgi:hypothetical protein